jgi:hypothetical protein
MAKYSTWKGVAGTDKKDLLEQIRVLLHEEKVVRKSFLCDIKKDKKSASADTLKHKLLMLRITRSYDEVEKRNDEQLLLPVY